MNVLVTGFNGFIGSVVTERLMDKNFNVIGIDNFSSSFQASVPKNMPWYKGDINDKKLLNHIFNDFHVDFVFHLAAESIIDKSMTDPSPFFKTNVAGGISLLDAMIENSVGMLIHSSTASSYGIPSEYKIVESHPQNPINAYGESKYLFERILKWYQKCYDLDYIMFRYFNVGGATEKNGERRKTETRLLPTIMKCILTDKVLNIFGNDYNTKDGTAIRDYLHVIDVADAHILAMERFDEEPVRNNVYNLGSETGFTILEIVKMCEEITKHKINYKFIDRRPGDPPVLIASREKAVNLLGWKAENSDMRKIIEDTWKWYKKNYVINYL